MTKTNIFEQLLPELVVHILEFNSYIISCRMLSVCKYLYRLLSHHTNKHTSHYMWQHHYETVFNVKLQDDSMEYRLMQLVSPNSDEALKNSYEFFKHRVLLSREEDLGGKHLRKMTIALTLGRPQFLQQQQQLPELSFEYTYASNTCFGSSSSLSQSHHQQHQQQQQKKDKAQGYKFQLGLHRSLHASRLNEDSGEYEVINQANNYDEIERVFDDYGSNLITNGGFTPASEELNPNQEPVFVTYKESRLFSKDQFIVLGDQHEPCLLIEVRRSVGGKFGFTKHWLIGIGLFSFRRYEDVKSSHAEFYVPIVTIRRYELVNVEKGNFATLMYNEELNRDLIVTAKQFKQHKRQLEQQAAAAAAALAAKGSSKQQKAANKNSSGKKTASKSKKHQQEEDEGEQVKEQEEADYSEQDQLDIDWYNEQALPDGTSRSDLQIPTTLKGVQMVEAFKKLSQGSSQKDSSSCIVAVIVMRSMGCEMIIDWQLINTAATTATK